MRRAGSPGHLRLLREFGNNKTGGQDKNSENETCKPHPSHKPPHATVARQNSHNEPHKTRPIPPTRLSGDGQEVRLLRMRRLRRPRSRVAPGQEPPEPQADKTRP